MLPSGLALRVYIPWKSEPPVASNPFSAGENAQPLGFLRRVTGMPYLHPVQAVFRQLFQQLLVVINHRMRQNGYPAGAVDQLQHLPGIGIFRLDEAAPVPGANSLSYSSP